MKNIIIALAYAIGIVLTEILAVAAWYCYPGSHSFDATKIVFITVILLPIITCYFATKNKKNKIIENGIIIGISLWCLMMIPICWTMPIFLNVNLLLVSLLLYIGLSIGSSLCIVNIRMLKTNKKQTKEI